MKKILCTVMAGVLCAAMAVPALASQETSVTAKTFIVVQDYDTYSGYGFARVENTGDEAIELDHGKLVAFDGSDNIIVSEDYVYAYPVDLQPGEYAYIMDRSYDIGTVDAISDFKVSISPADSAYYTTTRYESTGQYVAATDDWSSDCIVVSFTNSSEELISDITVVVAVLDNDGNILYADNESIYSVGVYPGSSIAYVVTVPDSIRDYYNTQSISLADGVIDTIVYVEE